MNKYLVKNRFFKNIRRKIDKDKLKEIENYITDAYSKGKINELHYNILKEKIGNITNSKEGSVN